MTGATTCSVSLYDTDCKELTAYDARQLAAALLRRPMWRSPRCNEYAYAGPEPVAGSRGVGGRTVELIIGRLFSVLVDRERGQMMFTCRPEQPHDGQDALPMPGGAAESESSEDVLKLYFGGDEQDNGVARFRRQRAGVEVRNDRVNRSTDIAKSLHRLTGVRLGLAVSAS